MEFGEVLKRAWHIIWNHKVLWLFGILAGCGSAGSGASGNSGGRGGQYSGDMGSGMENFFNSIDPTVLTILIIGFILVMLVLVILAIFLSTIGKIGIIRGTLAVEAGASRLTFGQLFSESTPYFWRVFGLNLLVGLLGALLGGGIAAFTVLGTIATLGIGLICLIPILCLLVPFFIGLALVTEQASIAIVTENVGIMDGLRHGWNVITANLGPIILMGLILGLGVGGVVGSLLFAPFLAIFAPIVLGLIATSGELVTGTLVVSGLLALVYLPIFLALNGALTSYVQTAWTLTYLRLTRPGRSLTEAL
jgi:hypothetical protein